MFLILLANKFFNKKTVFTVHGSYLFLSKVNTLLQNYILKKSDRIIFVNKMLYDMLPSKQKNVIDGKYDIFLNGVELNYDYEKSDVYKKYKLDSSNTIIFHPARFVIEKNHIRIISAFKSIAEKNKNIKLVLAGNGQLEEEIKDHIKKLGLIDNVILLGLIDRDEVYNFLERCDLFLMPSISEGLNIAFLEAISMHCKVIVSDIEQFTYPIELYGLNPDEINVRFVDPLEEKSIELGITSILKKKQIYSYDAFDFSLDTMMMKYERVYEELSA
jgi:glycosyltransferase involved in cell wall biosynthesis